MNETQKAQGEWVVHGLWWVAEAPASKVAGVLRYGSSHGIQLDLSADPLLGPSGSLEERLRRWHGHPNVILGQSDGRECFTVIDAIAIRIGADLRFFANRVLCGQHLADAEIATFSQVSFELEHLEAWAGGALLADSIAQDGKPGFCSKTLFTFETNAAHYEIRSEAWPFLSERESGINYTCTVLGTLVNPVTLQGVMGELEKFLSLMIILVGARPKPRTLLVSQSRESSPLELIIQWSRSFTGELIHHEMPVPFVGLGEAAPAIFSKWYAEWPIINQSVAMFLSACQTTYTDVKFLCLVNGLKRFTAQPRMGRFWRTRILSTGECN